MKLKMIFITLNKIHATIIDSKVKKINFSRECGSDRLIKYTHL